MDFIMNKDDCKKANSTRKCKWTYEPSRTFKLQPLDIEAIKRDLEKDEDEVANGIEEIPTPKDIKTESALSCQETNKSQILTSIPEEDYFKPKLFEEKENKLKFIKQEQKKNDSFDLDFSALSLHTPVKCKQKPLNCITPRINIIRPIDDKLKTPQVNNVNSIPGSGVNKLNMLSLFKTPQNSCRKAIPYSSAQKTTNYPYVKLATPMQQKYQPYSVPLELSAVEEKFERINVKDTEYIVLNLLGKGGSSEVFHCFNIETKTHAAIKCVSLKNPVTAEGYKREVKLLEELQKCDKIVRLYDYTILEEEEMLVVVLEKAGEDLSTILKKMSKDKSHIPVYMLLYYWLEMLYAVQQIHENGVIHADLKPANFLRCDGGLKLIDFGIASRVQDDMTSVYKQTQEGSCNYISPEALSEGSSNPNSPTIGKPKYQLHYKSDVWSLGCILYQLIYRRTPFQHLNQLWAKLAAIMNPNNKIQYPPANWVPQKFIETLKKCLQHNFKLRPSVKELIVEYEEIFKNL